MEAEEFGENYPTLYVDGEVREVEGFDLERVQVEFTERENGYSSDAQMAAPLGWVNSAAITLDREDDAVSVSISVGDPRGAFVMTVRRLSDGRLVMHLPDPSDSMPHLPLTQVRPGTLEVGS